MEDRTISKKPHKTQGLPLYRHDTHKEDEEEEDDTNQDSEIIFILEKNNNPSKNRYDSKKTTPTTATQSWRKTRKPDGGCASVHKDNDRTATVPSSTSTVTTSQPATNPCPHPTRKVIFSDILFKGWGCTRCYNNLCDNHASIPEEPERTRERERGEKLDQLTCMKEGLMLAEIENEN